MTVNFGTCAFATAITSFAPSRAMPPASYSRPDHEAGDVLEEDERHAPLAAELDEVRAFLRGLGEEHAVVREDPDRDPLDAREARDESLAVQRLELVEARAVDDPRDQLARVGLLAEVLGDEAVQLVRVERGRLGRRDVPGSLGPAQVEGSHDAAGERERVLVGGRVVVGDAGAPWCARLRRRAPRPSRPARSPPSRAAGRR